MNSSAIVARSLRNRHCVRLQIGRCRFRVCQPFVKDLSRIFSEELFKKNAGLLRQDSLRCLARILIRNSPGQRLFRWYAARYATCVQLAQAASRLAVLMNGQDLFDSVQIDRTRHTKALRTVGNNTVIGVVATLMDALHISYREAYERINYPTLLLMSVDKCRVLSGDECKVVKTSGREMANRRKKNAI